MYIKFPLALYRGGELLTVHSDEEEAAAHADGYTDWNSDNDAMTAAAAEGDDEAKAATRDEMKAEAKARGIEFAHNISNAKLAELLTAA